jgi:recombination protein RecA
LGAESGVIAKNGAYYTLGEESLGQGRERARATLMERVDLREKIEAALPKTVAVRGGGTESEAA